jgi:transcriptional regulator with XRE-family HTH domain
MDDIARRIRALLESRSQKQADLARVLDLGEDTVSKLLNGKRGLAAGELAELCAHYGVSSDYLLFGTTTEPVGVLLRADQGADTDALLSRIDEAFENLRYLRALTRT